MRSTKLWGYTLALRDEFPEAADLRIRMAKKPDRTVWQLVGKHPTRGNVAKQIKANSESEVFQGARDLLVQLNTGVKGRAMPTGAIKRHERAALEAIQARGYRDATERHKVASIRELSSWLADRSLQIDEACLRMAVLDLAPDNNRRRRAILEGAQMLAKSAGIKLETEGIRYKEPIPERRKAVDDVDIFRRLGKPLERIGDPGAIWIYRVVGVLGIRANGALSLKIPDVFDGDEYPDGGFQPGVQLPYWDSKRNRAGYATPTVRDWFDHWGLGYRPPELNELMMPCWKPATNKQIERANAYLSNCAALLRRKVHKDASKSIGFRSLRHAATARLLKSGMQPLLVADLLSTSLAQVEATYSDYFRQHAVSEAARLL